MSAKPIPVYVFETNAVELIWIRGDGSIVTLETVRCPPPAVIAARAADVRAELDRRGWDLPKNAD